MEPVTTMPVVEWMWTTPYAAGLLYDGLTLTVGSLLILLLLLLLWHSIKASRSSEMCRLAHYIALTKCIGMIGFGVGVMYTAYTMVLMGFKIAKLTVRLDMVWHGVAFRLPILVLGSGIFLWAYIQAAIFQLVAARADATPSCAQPVARGPNRRSPLDEEAAGQ